MKEYCTGPRAIPIVLLALAAAGAQAESVPCFESLDQNGDGVVSGEEASRRHGLRELIAAYDENGDGRLDRREYHALVEDAAREAERAVTAGD